MYGMTLVAVSISSLAYMLGGAVILVIKGWSRAALSALTALSAGLLLSIAILDLIPDTLGDLHGNGAYVLFGFLAMYLIQYGVRARRLSQEKAQSAPEDGNAMDNAMDRATVRSMSAGMLLHNFCEGLSIGISFAANVQLGLMVSLGMVLHKLPEGLSYSSAMFSSNHNRSKTAGLLLLQGLFTWIGAGIAVLLSGSKALNAMATAVPLSFAAGIFIYLSASSLLPALNKQHGKWIPVLFLGGIVLYYVLHGISEALS